MIRFAAQQLAVFAATTLVAAGLVYLLLRLTPAAFDGRVGAALAVTLPLVLLAAIVTGAIGVGLGALAARRPGLLVDKSLQGLSEIGAAVPNFWLGMLLAVVFSAMLRWLPAAGFMPWPVNPLAAFASLILPSLALAIPQGLALARLVRRAFIEAASSGYLRAAEARGLSHRDALRKHALPNAAAALAAGLGTQISALIAGAMIVENVFYLPGLGRLIFDAIGARDLPVVRSAILVLVLLLTGTAFLARLCRGWADPRLSEDRAA